MKQICCNCQGQGPIVTSIQLSVHLINIGGLHFPVPFCIAKCCLCSMAVSGQIWVLEPWGVGVNWGFVGVMDVGAAWPCTAAQLCHRCL